MEIPPGAITGSDPSMAVTTEGDEEPVAQPPAPEVEADLEIDEDFLRRIREV